jgi:glutamate synthase (NADPH/NADH) small chain
MSRTISNRIEVPKADVNERIKGFREVALGLSEEEAVLEGERCLQCKKPQCVGGCPVSVPIPEFIQLIKTGNFLEAAKKIKEKNNLPAICGRVCPQEVQCEKECILSKKGYPINIGALERFAADFERKTAGANQAEEGVEADADVDAEVSAETNPNLPDSSLNRKNKKVAIVGSGPAGLTAAADIAKSGYSVTIFEALHEGGGVLRYGIPEFRLPKDILEHEIEYVKNLGVDIQLNMIIGKSFTIEELFAKGYNAIFIGTGAGLPYFLNIPGEELNGVYSANEFLTRVNLMKGYLFPEYDTPVWIGDNVCVVGAGNVAMDAARTAMRLGAKNVSIVYRRSFDEMPARRDEVENAQEEGVKFNLLTNPIEIIDENGWVAGLKCVRMELGEPDESGRRKPVPVESSEFIMEADTIIVAIGQGANPILQASTPGLSVNKWGYIIADPETGETSIKGVYAGGDIVTGAATVISAMGAGRRAARAICDYLINLEK